MEEALAIKEALQHTIDLNIKNIWLRSDAQVLIRALSPGRHLIELCSVLWITLDFFIYFFTLSFHLH
ncbi:hypothetical protein Bca52824_095919 [Brassica carinata]|uniref:RNase H type-1 domain-containing protein n=1 Tax=Brassica carinata TaxID=52824 RepID=A0A8X7TIG6_BRACI|nr:hypothetical protein Bca52824_095919 [Brassica carinata]